MPESETDAPVQGKSGIVPGKSGIKAAPAATAAAKATVALEQDEPAESSRLEKMLAVAALLVSLGSVALTYLAYQAIHLKN